MDALVEKLQDTNLNNLQKIEYDGVSNTVQLVDEFSVPKAGGYEFVQGRTHARYLDKIRLRVVQRGYKLDLSGGFDPRNTFDYVDKHHMLEVMEYLCSKEERDLKKALHGAEVMSTRGILLRAAMSPYSSQEDRDRGWKVFACLCQGVLFLREKCNEVEEDRVNNLPMYTGMKFEQMLTENFDGTRDERQPVDQHQELLALFRITLEMAGRKVGVFTGAEMDCVDRETGEFVELKTTGYRVHPSKWLTTFFQNFMIGSNLAIFGTRDRYGQCYKINEYELDDLKSRADFKLDRCILYLMDFLDELRSRLVDLAEGAVVVAERLQHSRDYTIKEDRDGEYEFISEKFKKHFNL